MQQGQKEKQLRKIALRVGRVMVEVAPVVAMLSRTTHPVGWIATGIYLAKTIHTHWMADRPVAWPTLSWGQAWSILEMARSSGVGLLVDRRDSGEERLVDRTLYGAGPGWYVGPYGDPTPLIEGIWDQHEGLLLISTAANPCVLVADERSTEQPSRLVQEIANECVKLHQGQARVGLLIDGPPGTGKSHALLYAAQALGGRTLRTSFKTTQPTDLVGIALTLGATAVVLDDIDRGPTDSALDAIEQLTIRGVAVLASSNTKAVVCDALLRDGRIDDHRTFGQIEPDVLERMTEGLEPEIVERLRSCRVATVARYIERRRTLGAERAATFLPQRRRTLGALFVRQRCQRVKFVSGNHQRIRHQPSLEHKKNA